MLESLGVDWPECRVADVFAGSGSLGIEALSRGAASVLFVELAGKAVRLIRSNLEDLDVSRERWTLIKGDALRLPASAEPDARDLIFVDPPYGRDMLLPALRLSAERGWLRPGGLLCAETESSLDLPAAPHPDLVLLRDKSYGQTRICIWRRK